MLKKVFTVWIIIISMVFIFTLAGCSQETKIQETEIKNEEILIVNQTAVTVFHMHIHVIPRSQGDVQD